jgi:predicted Rossmann fold nucleotide-binding protein DprA/Smf involved in DNA uptake
MFDPVRLHTGEPTYPAALYLHLAERAPATVTARGNLALLHRRPLVAVFCSVQCSESVILQTYDLAQALSETGATVISGFHSPMEKECLATLLREQSPVIVCPARGVDRLRLSTDWKTALTEQRLLLLSAFPETQKHTTTQRALTRNTFVAALADAVLIAHATPKGRLEQLCEEVLAWGKPVFALEGAEQTRLHALGAQRVWVEQIRKGEAFVAQE